MRDLVIFGTGQIAEVAHYYLTQEGGRNVAAFTVDQAYVTAEKACGLPVVAFENVQDIYSPQTHDMFIAVIFRQLNKLR